MTWTWIRCLLSLMLFVGVRTHHQWPNIGHVYVVTPITISVTSKATKCVSIVGYASQQLCSRILTPLLCLIVAIIRDCITFTREYLNYCCKSLQFLERILSIYATILSNAPCSTKPISDKYSDL